MIKLSLLIFIFSLSSNSNAFFARVISDPIESCKKKDESFADKIHCIETNQTDYKVRDLNKLSDKLGEKVVQNYEDLRAAKGLSDKLYDQSIDSIKSYNNMLIHSRKSKIADKELAYSDGINLLVNVENKIKKISSANRCSGRANNKKNSQRLNNCKKRREALLAPHLANKAMLISSNPLLGNKHTAEMIANTIEEAHDEYYRESTRIRSCIRANNRSRNRTKKRCGNLGEITKKRDNEVFSYSRKDYLDTYQKSLKDSIKSAKKLRDRHLEVSNKIRNFFAIDRSVNHLESLRDDIYHDREIATDYYVSAGFSKDSGINDQTRCRIIAEYEANESNAFINSLAIDLAVMAIPMGGPLLMARVATRVSKISKGLQTFFTSKKIAFVSKFNTARAELSMLGVDVNALYGEKEHCEEVLSTADGLGKIPEGLKSAYDSCQQTLNNMTMSLVAASLGGAVGTFSMGKFLPSNLKSTPEIKLRPESNMTPEDIDTFLAFKDGNRFQLMTKKDMEAVNLAPDDALIEVEVKTLFSSDTKKMTRSELKEYLQKNEVDSLRVTGVETAREFSEKELKEISSKIDAENLAKLNEAPNEKMSVIVEYQSGELGSYSGNADMLKELALRGDIKSMKHTYDVPRSVESGFKVPASNRATGYDVVNSSYAKIANDSKYTISKSNPSDIEGVTLYHGTIKEMESSVRGGPKNVGKGFGGRGLYLDLSEDARIAKEYSGHAKAAAQNRLANISDNAQDAVKTADTTPIVMSGKLNVGSKDLNVGKFTIVRNGEVDLEKGILPANWDEDPRLVKMMEEKFHILDLRGMKSNGLNLDTDRILIIHENAGKDIIKWNDGVE
jgi:hypothetical protein